MNFCCDDFLDIGITSDQLGVHFESDCFYLYLEAIGYFSLTGKITEMFCKRNEVTAAITKRGETTFKIDYLYVSTGIDLISFSTE